MTIYLSENSIRKLKKHAKVQTYSKSGIKVTRVKGCHFITDSNDYNRNRFLFCVNDINKILKTKLIPSNYKYILHNIRIYNCQNKKSFVNSYDMITCLKSLEYRKSKYDKEKYKIVLKEFEKIEYKRSYFQYLKESEIKNQRDEIIKDKYIKNIKKKIQKDEHPDLFKIENNYNLKSEDSKIIDKQLINLIGEFILSDKYDISKIFELTNTKDIIKNHISNLMKKYKIKYIKNKDLKNITNKILFDMLKTLKKSEKSVLNR